MYIPYDIGDTVRIRNDITCRNSRQFIYGVNETMESKRGETAVITRLRSADSYCLDIDGGMWTWSYDMLLPTGSKQDWANANQGPVFGYDYAHLPAFHHRAVHSIENSSLRKRILHDIAIAKKNGSDDDEVPSWDEDSYSF